MIYSKGPQGIVGIRLSDLLLILGVSQRTDPGLYLRVLEEFFHTFSLHGVQSNTIPCCFFEGLQALRDTGERAPDGLDALMPLFIYLKRCRMAKHLVLGPSGSSEYCRLYGLGEHFVDPKVELRFIEQGKNYRERAPHVAFLRYERHEGDAPGRYFNPVSARFEIDNALRLVYEGDTPLEDHFRNQDDRPVRGYFLFPDRKGKSGVVPIGTLRFEEDSSSFKAKLTSETVLTQSPVGLA